MVVVMRDDAVGDVCVGVVEGQLVVVVLWGREALLHRRLRCGVVADPTAEAARVIAGLVTSCHCRCQ